MADSNITKKALAAALKELMAEMPFSKINISDICDKCNMNRKSFYYHFQDKYDLVNWIYDTEFIAAAKQKSYGSTWQFLNDICIYFYANKDFYRKALHIKGQNSFSEHFRELMLPLITEYLKNIFSEQEILPFHINFFADAYICAIERWLLDKNCIPPDEFLALLKSCIEKIAAISTGELHDHIDTERSIV